MCYSNITELAMIFDFYVLYMQLIVSGWFCLGTFGKIILLDLSVLYAHLTFKELLLATSSLWKLTKPTNIIK